MTQTTSPLRIGVLGSGGIATASYGVLPNIAKYGDLLEITALADPAMERAGAVARQYSIPGVHADLTAMIAAGGIDAVVNLTPIPLHFATSREVLEAGLHLVTEKPLASTLEEADELIRLAQEKGVTIVCAPPDMLHEPYARAAEFVRDGQIGRIAFARVHSSHAGPGGGPEGWESDPTWFYQQGSGPLLDMGVYGIHEITGILGPARRVVAFSGITDKIRTVRGTGEFGGLEIPVGIEDNNLFMLDFGHSVFAVVDGSYNLHASTSPKIEIFGREGVINILQPGHNDLEMYRTDLEPGVDGWVTEDKPLAENTSRATYGRALMVGHLAECLRDGKRPVLSAEHARHALDIMLAVETSARESRVVELTTTF